MYKVTCSTVIGTAMVDVETYRLFLTQDREWEVTHLHNHFYKDFVNIVAGMPPAHGSNWNTRVRGRLLHVYTTCRHIPQHTPSYLGGTPIPGYPD